MRHRSAAAEAVPSQVTVVRRRFAVRLPCLLLSAVVAGCAHYAALPLSTGAGLANSVFGLDGAPPPGRPLTVADVARLAVLNSPDLQATRAQSGVSRAQLLQAGLPPNPQITGSILPLAAGVGNTNAWNAGLSYDLKSLITLRSRRRGAEDTAEQVDAQIMWQEWQTAGQARMLAIDLIEGNRLLGLLTRTEQLLATREQRSRAALAEGNVTLGTIAPDIAARQSARTQINDLQRVLLSRRHQLAALLGVQPDAPLPLTATPDLPPYDPAAIMRALPELPNRRPDLIALQLGYRAQDNKVRAAILAQFPNLTFGVTGGSDNSGVRNIGPQITLELPIFDHNQGNIAIERATREQLHAEYAARLAAADGQIRATLSEIGLLQRQLVGVKAELPALQRAASSAESAFNAGEIDDRSYVDLVFARYAKEQELVVIEQTLLDQQVALATLSGAGMPVVVLPPEAQ
ncbi:MAG: TolC family protein [Pseudomonadota bacterium]|nr:TolC family protein [Pseudomonadota bacterium]